MITAIFKNMSGHRLYITGQIIADPLETFSAPLNNNDIHYLVSRGLLKHMKEFDTVGTKEARPEVLNKDTWDMI